MSPTRHQAEQILTVHRTFFQDPDIWPMHDNADPLNEWSLQAVEETPSGPASADIYGKLFYHIRAMLQAFLLRLSGLQTSFRLLQVNARDLSDHLENASFNRIEVRNLHGQVRKSLLTCSYRSRILRIADILGCPIRLA